MELQIVIRDGKTALRPFPSIGIKRPKPVQIVPLFRRSNSQIKSNGVTAISMHNMPSPRSVDGCCFTAIRERALPTLR